MTEQETIKVVTLIVMSYPAIDSFKDENTIKAMINVWKQMFKDDDPRCVELAVQKHIVTNKWPPSIAEIRETMADIFHPELIPPDVAWASVVDLLDSSGSLSDGKEYDFPPMIARVIDTIGWHHLYELHRGSYGGKKDGLDRVAFMELYRPAYERARQSAMLPMSIRSAIEAQHSPETVRYLESAREARQEREKLIQGKMQLYLPDECREGGNNELHR